MLYVGWDSFLSILSFSILCFFFFKQKTAYEMRISDWSSDVCSSDLIVYSLLRSIPSGVTSPGFTVGSPVEPIRTISGFAREYYPVDMKTSLSRLTSRRSPTLLSLTHWKANVQ